MEAKRSAGESTAGFTFEKVAASLRSSTEKAKQKNPNGTVEYDVVVENGKPRIKQTIR